MIVREIVPRAAIRAERDKKKKEKKPRRERKASLTHAHTHTHAHARTHEKAARTHARAIVLTYSLHEQFPTDARSGMVPNALPH